MMNETFDEEQRKAIESDSKRISVIATAGAGKTLVLSRRIEYLVINKAVSPNRILALTFTNKARDEMASRIGHIIEPGLVQIQTLDSFAKYVYELFIGKRISIKDESDDGEDAYTFEEIRHLAVKALSDRDFRISFSYQYDHILVDEFQDVEEIMFTMINSILNEDNCLFVVGDDDQNVYRWRGAESKYLIHFKDSFPVGEVIILDKCFRCSGNIVDVMNTLINYNKIRYPKIIVTDNPQGYPVMYRLFHYFEDEVQYIISEIKHLISIGYKLSEIAVLYRRNSFVNKAIEIMLSFGLSDINVTTIHAAKGEQYRAVFVPSLNEGILPLTENRANNTEDERRALFVAISRAKERLYLSSFTCMIDKGHSETYKESRFIREIKDRIATVKQGVSYYIPKALECGKRYYYLATGKNIVFICLNSDKYIFGDESARELALTQKEVLRWVRVIR